MVLQRVVGAEVRARDADLAHHVEREGLVVHREPAAVAAHVGHHLVVDHELRERERHLRLELPDAPDEAHALLHVGDEAEHRLERRLLVLEHRLGGDPRGRRQAVEAAEGGRGAGEERVLRAAGDGDGAAHVEDVAEAEVVDDGAARLEELVDDDAGQDLGVADGEGAGERHRARSSRPSARR